MRSEGLVLPVLVTLRDQHSSRLKGDIVATLYTHQCISVLLLQFVQTPVDGVHHNNAEPCLEDPEALL